MSSTLETLVTAVTKGGAPAAQAFDELAATGAQAVPFIVAALERERSVPQLTAALAAVRVPDPTSELEPYLRHPSDVVRQATIEALGRCGDDRAVDLFAAILARREHVAATLRALGTLGFPSAAAPLRDHARELLGGPFSPDQVATLQERAVADLDPYPLTDLSIAAMSLAKLGDMSLAPAACALSRFRADDPEFVEDGDIRLAAVGALDMMVGPGVAAALESACDDSRNEVAEAAMFALVHLGRPRFAERLAGIVATGLERPASIALYCLQQILGERAQDAQVSIEAARRLDPRRCYRFGDPATPGLLIPGLRSRDAAVSRAELLQATGLRFLAVGMDEAPASEIGAVDAWWAEHHPRFQPGQLHRWGRSYDPEATD